MGTGEIGSLERRGSGGRFVVLLVFSPSPICVTIQQCRRFGLRVEEDNAYFTLRLVFKLYTFMDVVVVLGVTYVTGSSVTGDFACIFPESVDVVV